MRPRHLVSLLLLTLTAACAEMGDLITLQRGIASRFEEAGVSVNVENNSLLTVTFRNSRVAARSDAARAAFARSVAEYVRDTFPEYGSLREVDVAFARVQTDGPLTVTHTDAPYRFARDELGSPRGTPVTPTDSSRRAMTTAT